MENGEERNIERRDRGREVRQRVRGERKGSK